ncbi:b(0,+)-type amino acid transporter 1-like [Crassostrea angulata]|uniref:b(0,+)-type amino acid transporter 1-like n=1 Tax=Magallana angulata TaxID=2784310 RepID=UPI0022B19B2D|nr:b(0,+)-type amino acid transporter 1-like [Crassostrea angulata]
MDNPALCQDDGVKLKKRPVTIGGAPRVEVGPTGIKLRRNLGLISGTSVIVGTIIGSGIFISPKGVLQETGSVGLSLVVWAAGGMLSLMGALSYAELGTLISKSGAEYHYLMAALGRVVAFLFAWTKVFILTPSSLAIICLTFAEYVMSLMEFCGEPQIPKKMIAALAILTLAIVNSLDTTLAASVQVFFTGAKLIALVIIVIGGLIWLGKGEVATLQKGFEGSTSSPSGMALAFYDAMWAYDGWHSLNYITEELKTPYVNLPRANVLGVLLVTVIYVLTNISYLAVLGTEGLLNSSAVALEWGEVVLGNRVAVIMPLFVMCSTIGSANGTMFAGGRTLYVAARENQFPEVLSYVNIRRVTPIPCIIFTTVVALLMLIPGDIGSLINFVSFASWMFYSLAIVSLIVLRFIRKNEPRPIKVFILFPIIFLCCSLYLVVAPIIQNPRLEFLYAFLIIIGGLVFYVPLVHFRIHKSCFNPVTLFVQLLMEVGPSSYVPDSE